MQEKILLSVKLTESHKTTSASRRYIRGSFCTQRPVELRIVRYDEGPDVYLIEYDENQKELIDTFHSNVKEGMKQAEFDWGIKASDWIAHF